VPEGDTIHRTANRLRAVLAGERLVRLEIRQTPVGKPEGGTVISDVEAVGKHLLIGFADGNVLRSHMRMSGAWHVYRSGERWRKPPHLARAVIEVEGWTAVCFAAPVVELERTRESAMRVASLGPDLTRPDVSDADIERGVDRMPAGEIGAVLLDQRVVAGIGNIFKSETLFVCGVSPFTDTSSLDRATKHKLLATASKLLRSSVAGAARPRNVFGRSGQPCKRCGTPVRSQAQGELQRTTYWCPSCQT
jgi:endonuclease-8